jgi:uncharacterized protein YkwD
VPSKALTCVALTAGVVVGSTAQSQVSQQREATVITSKARAGIRSDELARAVRADTTEAARRVVVLTNEFRRQQNLEVLGPSPQLASAARYFADFMARNGKYGHSADGSEPAARAKRFGYDYCIVAENIAYTFTSEGTSTIELANRLFKGWQNSPEHRENMLNPHVTETAVAVAHSPKIDYYYAVQLFGRPKSRSIEFKVANRTGVAVEYALDGQTFQLPTRATSTHQVCKRAVLEFRGKTLQPVNGQQLVIVNDQNGIQLQAQ